MHDEPCRDCGDNPKPGPVLYQVKPQGAPHSDSAFTCAVHLPTTIQAYARLGYDSLVKVLGLPKEESK